MEDEDEETTAEAATGGSAAPPRGFRSTAQGGYLTLLHGPVGPAGIIQFVVCRKWDS